MLKKILAILVLVVVACVVVVSGYSICGGQVMGKVFALMGAWVLVILFMRGVIWAIDTLTNN